MSMTQHLAFTAGVAGLAGSVVLVSPVAGQAQISPILARQGSMLNRADFDLADAGARKPLDPQPASLGTTAAWPRIGRCRAATWLVCGVNSQRGS